MSDLSNHHHNNCPTCKCQHCSSCKCFNPAPTPKPPTTTLPTYPQNAQVEYVYYWYSADGVSTQAKVLQKIPAHTTHVIFSFAISTLKYQKGSYDFGQCGFEGMWAVPDLPGAIRELKARGIKTLISVGGWGYSNSGWNWTKDSARQLVDLCRDIDAVGIDIDYELDNGQYENNLKGIISDIRQYASIGSGFEINATIMAYMKNRTVNVIKALPQGSLTRIQLMTYSDREDETVAQKREPFVALDKDPYFDTIGVMQGFCGPNFSKDAYNQLANDVKGRVSSGKRSGMFFWGNIDGFVNDIVKF